jgi:DNA-binding phage protein
MSRKTSWICEIRDSIPLAPRHLGYFERKLRNDFHAAILKLFRERAAAGMTRADLARKLDKRPEQITRWLSAPGNWTFDTAAALALAMGSRFEITAVPLEEAPPDNRHHPLAGYIPGSGGGSVDHYADDPAPTVTDRGNHHFIDFERVETATTVRA